MEREVLQKQVINPTGLQLGKVDRQWGSINNGLGALQFFQFFSHISVAKCSPAMTRRVVKSTVHAPRLN
jgi:hypothetical protein